MEGVRHILKQLHYSHKEASVIDLTHTYTHEHTHRYTHISCISWQAS